MAISRRALLALTLLVVSPLLFLVLRSGNTTAAAQQLPIVSSPNFDFLTTVARSAAISGEFSPSAPYFSTSGLDSQQGVRFIDVSDPKAIKQSGTCRHPWWSANRPPPGPTRSTPTRRRVRRAARR